MITITSVFDGNGKSPTIFFRGGVILIWSGLNVNDKFIGEKQKCKKSTEKTKQNRKLEQKCSTLEIMKQMASIAVTKKRTQQERKDISANWRTFDCGIQLIVNLSSQ